MNLTHRLSLYLGWRISKWSWWNLRLGFAPPRVHSVTIRPITPPDPLDTFDHAMFRKGGMLEDVPMNHYWCLSKRGSTDTLMLNCGAVLQSFALGEKYGYQSIKEALDYYDSDSTEGSTDEIPQTRLSQQAGNSSPTNRDGPKETESDHHGAD